MGFNRVMLVLVAFGLTAAVAYGESYNLCREDHQPPPFEPPLPDKIGEVAGFQVLGLFLSLGGFGCPDSVMSQIMQINADYQEDDFLARYDEAQAIHEWLDSTHDVYVEGTPPYDCPVCGFPHNAAEYRALVLEKLGRRNEISAEIDAIWAGLALDAWALVPEGSREAYLDWFDTVDRGE